MGGEQQQQQRQHRVEPRLTVEPQREAQPYKPQIDAVPSSVQLTPASTGPPPDLQNSATMIGLASRPTGFVIHSEAHNSHAGRPREPLPQKLGNLTPATAPSQAQGDWNTSILACSPAWMLTSLAALFSVNILA